MSSSDGARSVGITQDLMARRKEPTRAGLGAAVSASEALLGHLRGLSTGLPGPDRALLTLLAERVRRGDLPPRGPADPARARHLAERGRLPSLDRAARVDPELWGWAAALRSPAELVVLDDAELAHARLAGLAAIDLADAAGVSPVEAFLGAALHDLGRPFLRGLAASLARPPRPATVQQLAEGLHPAVGSVLLERWGLPAAACLAVEHHHQPAPAIPRSIRALGRVVQAAHHIAELAAAPGGPETTGPSARSLEAHLVALGVEPDLALLAEVFDEHRTWRAVDDAFVGSAPP